MIHHENSIILCHWRDTCRTGILLKYSSSAFQLLDVESAHKKLYRSQGCIKQYNKIVPTSKQNINKGRKLEGFSDVLYCKFIKTDAVNIFIIFKKQFLVRAIRYIQKYVVLTMSRLFYHFRGEDLVYCLQRHNKSTRRETHNV